jgi:hypothetical protein
MLNVLTNNPAAQILMSNGNKSPLRAIIVTSWSSVAADNWFPLYARLTCSSTIPQSPTFKLKEAAPANKTIVVTLANGSSISGYIYSDDAYSHLTFQVIGSRLKCIWQYDNFVMTFTNAVPEG